MIEKKLKTTNGTITVKIPSGLDELTLGQLIQLQEKPDLNDVEAISILSGISVNQLHNVSDITHFQVFTDVVISLAQQIKQLYNKDRIPKTICFLINQKPVEVNVMHNLSIEPAGAFMAASDIIAEEIDEHINQFGADDWAEHFNPSLKACSHVLAHYFYCKATGNRYDEYKAEEFVNEIKKTRVTEALPIARHFFTCYPHLSKQKTSFFHRLHLPWKKKLALMGLKNLAI